MAEQVETPIGTVTPGHFRPDEDRRRVAAGPTFLYSLYDPDDRHHLVSRAFLAFLRDGDLPYRRLVVNEHAVDEVATLLKERASVQNAATFLKALDESDCYRLETVPEDVFVEATKAFVERPELDASFTDVVVATHATELGIDHVLTYDRHYDAFGVTTLPYRSPD